MGQTGPREIGANLAFGVNLALFILQCKDYRTSLPGPYSIIQYRIRRMRVRLFH